MNVEQLIKEQQMETREIVNALLEDGSDPKATYAIEHHFASESFDALEKAAVDAFKAGFAVDDAEELELEDGSIAYCFSAMAEHELSVERIDADSLKLIELAQKHKVLYDCWGTHFVEQGGAAE